MPDDTRALHDLKEGLGAVLPVELFPLFTGGELQAMICGDAEVQVDLLRAVCEFDGLAADSDLVTWFWEVLFEMTTKDKQGFLLFVWARSNLPSRVSDFEQPFKLQMDSKSTGKSQEEVDLYLPTASTCFFSLSLPAYSSKDILKRKLLAACKASPNMDSDFATNASELAAGWGST